MCLLSNRVGLLPSKNDVLSLLAISQQLGSGYNGRWVTPAVLEITVSDPLDRETFTQNPRNVVVDMTSLTFAVKRDGALRNSQQNSGVSTSQSPPMTGYFGIAPTIQSVTAFPFNVVTDDEYSAGDSIVLVFDEDTDYGNKSVTNPTVLKKAEVDALFVSSQNLGSNYRGIWENRKTFRITILSVDGAEPPQIQVGGNSAVLLTCLLERASCSYSYRATVSCSSNLLD